MAGKVNLSGKVVLRFDGPPETYGPRFIEAERDGKSINAGDWVPDGGNWLLVLHDSALLLLQINGLIDELDGAMHLAASTAAFDTDTERWLGYVRNRLRTIVKTDAERTKEP